MSPMHSELWHFPLLQVLLLSWSPAHHWGLHSPGPGTLQRSLQTKIPSLVKACSNGKLTECFAFSFFAGQPLCWKRGRGWGGKSALWHVWGGGGKGGHPCVQPMPAQFLPFLHHHSQQRADNKVTPRAASSFWCLSSSRRRSSGRSSSNSSSSKCISCCTAQKGLLRLPSGSGRELLY